LANQPLKIEIILFGQTSANQDHLTFDNFGTNLTPSQIPLPVTFAGFEGQKSAKGIVLIWKVAGESNVKQYDVERSTIGNGGFVKIGSTRATGNSSYTFTDETVLTSAVFYRIKNVDNDGQFRYSTVLAFRNGTGAVVFKVVPTLVTNKTVVQHPASTGAATITLSTTDGRTVYTIRPTAGAVETSIDMSGLQPGLYLLKWSSGTGAVETAKVVKQ